jgi:hypothetical protein
VHGGGSVIGGGLTEFLLDQGLHAFTSCGAREP